MAVVLAEFFRAYPAVGWSLEASDISNRMLEQASRGIYKLDGQHSLPLELLRRYLREHRQEELRADEVEGTKQDQTPL